MVIITSLNKNNNRSSTNHKQVTSRGSKSLLKKIQNQVSVERVRAIKNTAQYERFFKGIGALVLPGRYAALTGAIQPGNGPQVMQKIMTGNLRAYTRHLSDLGSMAKTRMNNVAKLAALKSRTLTGAKQLKTPGTFQKLMGFVTLADTGLNAAMGAREILNFTAAWSSIAFDVPVIYNLSKAFLIIVSKLRNDLKKNKIDVGVIEVFIDVFCLVLCAILLSVIGTHVLLLAGGAGNQNTEKLLTTRSTTMFNEFHTLSFFVHLADTWGGVSRRISRRYLKSASAKGIKKSN